MDTKELDFAERESTLFDKSKTIHFAGFESIVSILKQPEFDAALAEVELKAREYSQRYDIPLVSWDDYCDDETNGGTNNLGEPYDHGVVLEMFGKVEHKLLWLIPFTTWESFGDPKADNALFEAVQYSKRLQAIVIEAFVS